MLLPATWPSSFFAGPYMNPKSAPCKFGAGVKPYRPNQTCVLFVKPLPLEGRKSVFWNVDYVALDDGDDLRIYVFNDTSTGLVRCVDLQTETLCVANACAWQGSSCGVGCSEGPELCPQHLGAFALVRVFNYARTLAAVAAGNSPLKLPFSIEGGLVVLRTDLTSGSGLGASLNYVTTETFCRNDCKDAQGTLRGKCIENVTNVFLCACSTGFTGLDCSQRTKCLGVNEAAESIAGPSGECVYHVPATLSKSPAAAAVCGFSLVANPRQSVLQRMAAYVLGLAVTTMTLRSKNCSESYILIREGSYTGTPLRKICQSDIASTYVVVLTKSLPSVYVEFSGLPEDGFAVKFTAVSTVCPGRPQRSGIPTPQDECDDRGVCTDVNYLQLPSLPQFSKQCVCSNPFAPTSPYATCDTCAFGFRQELFPSCPSAIECTNSSDCNDGGNCVHGFCECEEPYFGLKCQRKHNAAVSGGGSNANAKMHQRLSLNNGDACNAAGSLPDTTLLSCAIQGANVPCVVQDRTVGLLQGDSDVDASATSAPARRRVAFMGSEHDMHAADAETAPPENLNVDTGLFLNKLVIQNNFRDFIRILNISGTNRDLSGSFTLTAWVMLDVNTNGFLFIKHDAGFFADGGNPAVDKALVDVTDRYIPLKKLQLYDEAQNVYFGLHLDGKRRYVSIIASDPSKKEGVSHKESWLYVRQFRLKSRGSVLFDGTWRFISLSIQPEPGRVAARLYIDGHHQIANPEYVQCVPFLPVQTLPGAPNTSNPFVVNIRSRGAITMGAHYRGGLDEIRAYSEGLPQKLIISIGGPGFDKELQIHSVVLLASAITGFVMIVVCVHLILVRKRTFERQLQEDEAQEMEGGAVATLFEELDSESGEDEGLTISAVEAVPVVVAIAPADEQDVSLHVRSSVADDNSPNDESMHRKEGESECPTAADLPGQVQIAAPPPEITLPHTNSTRLAVRQGVMKKRKQIAKLGVQATKVARKANGDGCAQNGGGGGGSQGGQLSGILSGVSRTTGDAKDFAARLFIARDSWQSIALFFVGFQWPTQFQHWFGTVAAVVSLKFTVSLPVSYETTYYVLIALSFLSFVLLLLVALTERHKTADEIAAHLAHIHKMRSKAAADGKKYSYNRGLRGKVAWVSLFVLSTLYIPVTTSAIEVLTCHPNVQCVFDCYNTAAYWAAFYTGLAAGILITIVTPVIMCAITFQVTSEYRHFLLAQMGDATLVRLERHWTEYIEAMDSAYNSIYDPYHYRYAFMGTFANIVKATLCFVTLGLPPDTSPQIIAIIVVQCVFASVLYLIAPFKCRVCNWIVQLSQAYVLFAVALACMYRMDPDKGAVYGLVLNVLAIITGAFQFGSFFVR